MTDSLFAYASLDPVAVASNITAGEFQSIYELRRSPVILRDDSCQSKQSQVWNIDYFKRTLGLVTTQKPDGTGLNVFSEYEVIPFSQFADSMSKEGDHRYIGAIPVMGRKGKILRDSEFRPLVPDIEIPKWVDKRRISTTNLWIGGGENHTLLHFDPWHSIIEVVAGSKKFAIFDATLTRALHPYPLLNFGTKGGSLDSMINGRHVQSEFVESVKLLSGFIAEVHSGDYLFVPAGFWHYVESNGINIAVNFFFHSTSFREKYSKPILRWRLKHIAKAPIRGINRIRRAIPRPVKNLIRGMQKKVVRIALL